jgi:hypothetical protein
MLEALVWPQRRPYKNYREVFGIVQIFLSANGLFACAGPEPFRSSLLAEESALRRTG